MIAHAFPEVMGDSAAAKMTAEEPPGTLKGMPARRFGRSKARPSRQAAVCVLVGAVGLDAPVLRCASLDTPIPFNIELEKNFMAKSRLDETIQKLINY